MKLVREYLETEELLDVDDASDFKLASNFKYTDNVTHIISGKHHHEAPRSLAGAISKF